MTSIMHHLPSLMYKSQCLTDYYAREDRGLVPEAGGGARYEGSPARASLTTPRPEGLSSQDAGGWPKDPQNHTVLLSMTVWCNNVVERSSSRQVVTITEY